MNSTNKLTFNALKGYRDNNASMLSSDFNICSTNVMNWRRGRVRVRLLNETENIDSSTWNNGINLVHVRK